MQSTGVQHSDANWKLDCHAVTAELQLRFAALDSERRNELRNQADAERNRLRAVYTAIALLLRRGPVHVTTPVAVKLQTIFSR